jgi:exodeoxyribonuclease-5
LANTDDEALVLGASVDRHPKYPQFKIWKIDVRMETGDKIILRVIHEDSVADLEVYLNEMAQKKIWGKFWECKDRFHQVKYAYAITSHRSQGSTFKHVFIDTPDIMKNRDASTRTKCLYVAASRASEQLYMLET